MYIYKRISFKAARSYQIPIINGTELQSHNRLSWCVCPSVHGGVNEEHGEKPSLPSEFIIMAVQAEKAAEMREEIKNQYKAGCFLFRYFPQSGLSCFLPASSCVKNKGPNDSTNPGNLFLTGLPLIVILDLVREECWSRASIQFEWGCNCCCLWVMIVNTCTSLWLYGPVIVARIGSYTL